MTPSDTPGAAAATDDQHWLDLLAGRSAPGADAGTHQQAARLRAALLSDCVAAPAGAPAPADERAVRLLQRARTAGVLPAAADTADRPAPPASLPNVRQARGRAANHWRYAAAACVAACAVLLFWPPGRVADDGAGSATLRGAAQQRIAAADPVSGRQQALQALRDAGFDAEPFDRLGRPGIDIALPVPLPPAQAAALRRLGLQPPAGPSLQIEFVAPAREPAQTPAQTPTQAPAR